MRYIQKHRAELKQRILTGKKVHWTGEEKQQIMLRKETIRNKFEMRNLGDYELIYPPSSEKLKEYYQPLLEQAVLNWEEFTTGKKQNPPTKFIVSQNKFTPQKPQPPPRKPTSDLPQISQKKEFRNTFANEMRTIA